MCLFFLESRNWQCVSLDHIDSGGSKETDSALHSYDQVFDLLNHLQDLLVNEKGCVWNIVMEGLVLLLEKECYNSLLGVCKHIVISLKGKYFSGEGIVLQEKFITCSNVSCDSAGKVHKESGLCETSSIELQALWKEIHRIFTIIVTILEKLTKSSTQLPPKPNIGHESEQRGTFQPAPPYFALFFAESFAAKELASKWVLLRNRKWYSLFDIVSQLQRAYPRATVQLPNSPLPHGFQVHPGIGYTRSQTLLARQERIKSQLQISSKHDGVCECVGSNQSALGQQSWATSTIYLHLAIPCGWHGSVIDEENWQLSMLQSPRLASFEKNRVSGDSVRDMEDNPGQKGFHVYAKAGRMNETDSYTCLERKNSSEVQETNLSMLAEDTTLTRDRLCVRYTMQPLLFPTNNEKSLFSQDSMSFPRINGFCVQFLMLWNVAGIESHGVLLEKRQIESSIAWIGALEYQAAILNVILYPLNLVQKKKKV